MARKVKRRSNIFSQAFTLLCAVVFVYSSYSFVTIYFEYKHNREVLAEAQELYQPTNVQENPVSLRESFEDLQEINEDIIGWIQIKDTMINYPVLQTTDNVYYLDRNYKLETSRAGSIFADYRNDFSKKDRHIILYGHRMKDQSMFQQLTNYLDEDFFNKHRIVYFDTLYRSYDAIVFSAYKTTTDFDYIKTEFENDESFATFIQEIREKSHIVSDEVVTEEDQILTLSTCDYSLDRDKGRLVVHAKLIER